MYNSRTRVQSERLGFTLPLFYIINPGSCLALWNCSIVVSILCIYKNGFWYIYVYKYVYSIYFFEINILQNY